MILKIQRNHSKLYTRKYPCRSCPKRNHRLAPFFL